MEIADVKTLVRKIKSSNEELAIEILKGYSDNVATYYINRAWSRARVLVRHISKTRKERIKKEMLGYDELSGVITLIQFTKFVARIEDLANEHYARGNQETKDAIEDIISGTYNSLSDVRIDKRLIFNKEG